VNARASAEVLIGLGGNVGDVRLTIARAIAQLCDGTGLRLLKRSADYRTPPWGVTDQPPFVNACISAATELAPRGVLDRALAVERALGRDRAREERWGPRRIDIDLLAYGDLTIDEPGLELPHPRLMQRAFVLVPLAEIVPDRVVAGQRIAEAATRLDAGGIERLPPDPSTP
jgi:2-amino-4-hydroxy-6-hydroxymethyldihydropteridine diphosphokinase